MPMSHRTAMCLVQGLLLAGVPAMAAAPQARVPAPSGRQVPASDGDTIVVDGDDRIAVLRRREARVRVVADEAAGTVLVMADWGAGATSPDGRVDRTWRFLAYEGRWPLDPRWEGGASLLVADGPTRLAVPELVLETSAGLIAFVGGPPQAPAPDGAVSVIRFRDMSSGGRDGLTFDGAERDALSPGFMSSKSTFGFSPMGMSVPGSSPGGGAGVVSPPVAGAVLSQPRMGGGPRLVHRVEPELPQQARDAGVMGWVILEVSVTRDGTVREARVLRSVPLLDEAAVRAVLQWRYEPAGPEGRPDPVRLTVAVPFRSQP